MSDPTPGYVMAPRDVLQRTAEALAAYLGAMRVDSTDDRASIMARIKSADAIARTAYAEIYGLLAAAASPTVAVQAQLTTLEGFLETVEMGEPRWADTDSFKEAQAAIASLRALIARLSQEPAAAQAGAGGVLSDEQIDAAIEALFPNDNHYHEQWLQDVARPIARAILAASHPQGTGKGGGSDSDGAREDQRG